MYVPLLNAFFSSTSLQRAELFFFTFFSFEASWLFKAPLERVLIWYRVWCIFRVLFWRNRNGKGRFGPEFRKALWSLYSMGANVGLVQKSTLPSFLLFTLQKLEDLCSIQWSRETLQNFPDFWSKPPPPSPPKLYKYIRWFMLKKKQKMKHNKTSFLGFHIF